MTQQKRKKGHVFQSGDLSLKKGEHLSEEQNKALRTEFDFFIQKNAYCGQRVEENYLIAYSLEYARNFTYSEEGDPQWNKLGKENSHIGIAVHDATDLHFISGLTVHVTVIDERGYPIGTFNHPHLQRPNLYHYGRNWILPGDGKYTLRVKIETPDNQLNNVTTGNVYATPIEVEFKNVTIKTGQKIN